MKINNYKDFDWYEEFNGKRVRVVEKDGEITKGKCRVFIEGYDKDDDRDMVIGIKGILIDDIVEIFGNTVSKISIPSKDEVVQTSIGTIFVSKDWREYGPKAYWNEFVNCCKKKHIIIKKKVIRYQPTSNKFIYV